MSINNLLTESECSTGKYQTEVVQPDQSRSVRLFLLYAIVHAFGKNPKQNTVARGKSTKLVTFSSIFLYI